MPVQDYLEAKKTARKELDTLIYDIERAYSSGVAKLKGDDGYIDMDLLNNSTGRESLEDEVISELCNNAKTYLGLSEEDFNQLNDLKQGRLLSAYLGTTVTGIKEIFGAYKENISRESFMKEIQKQMQGRFRDLEMYPSSKLSQADAPEVVKYTGLKGKVNLEKLELKDMAELLDNFDRFKVVPPVFLEGKSYKI